MCIRDRYISPLSTFGRPYIDENQQDNMVFWTDYYEFQDQKLVNINQKYRSTFDVMRRDSKFKIDTMLNQIELFKMTDDPTFNQLQLEEYFNKIVEHKTIIFRCNNFL